MVFKRIKDALSSSIGAEPIEDDYIEIDLEHEEKEKKVLVKIFELNQYDDVGHILESLREGYTIAMIDFKVLKQKDPIELKRAVSKIKKTVDALEGSIAGHDNFVIVTPSFARIQKHIKEAKKPSEEKFY